MKISYRQALQAALAQEMARDEGVFLYGVGLGTRDQFFGSIEGLAERFGRERVLDMPIAEESLMGFGLGAAVNGLHPVNHHIRPDFLLRAMDQLVNMVAPYSFGVNGMRTAPLVIRAVIGRGWGQGWQHSKSMASLFAHIPGLKVVLPTTPADAKGYLAGAIRDGGPVLVLEHRWLYDAEDVVPEGEYVLPIAGPGSVLRAGKDITLVATSWATVEALRAAEVLARLHGVQAEVVDPRVVAPLDLSLVIESVGRTRLCIIIDNDWRAYGLGAEFAAQIAASWQDLLLAPIVRLGWQHTPVPTARALEDAFYRDVSAEGIIRAVEAMLRLPRHADLSGEEFYAHENKFRGPF